MNWTREKPTKPGWYWVRCGNAVPPRVEEVAERWGKLYCQGFPAADYHQDWEFAGPIPEPGECIDADLYRFVEAGTKAWADVPDASAWVEEQRGNKPERCGEGPVKKGGVNQRPTTPPPPPPKGQGGKPATCGECGIRGPACYPRAVTDKACADARQEPSAAPGTMKDADPGQDHFRGSTGAAIPRQTKDSQ